MTDDLLAGRYRRLQRIGAGGMGEVWLCEDTVLGRRVAVKRVHVAAEAADPAARERLQREARLAARLDHPNAVTVHDVLAVDGVPHLVMQYVDGRTLSDLAADAPLDPLVAARLLAGVAEALADAHALGIVHRDIKPSNVLVDARGRALLADFGIARAVADSRLTGTGDFIGTPAYLAPEVARGEDAGPASDVYALGATLHAVIEGRPPFDDGTSNPLVILSRVLTQPLAPPVRSGPVTELLMALLAPDPASRPSAARAAEALRDVTAPEALRDVTAPAPADVPTVVGRRAPVPVAEVEQVDPLATLLGALEHTDAVTGGWSGPVEEWESLVVEEIAPQLRAGDRVDLFVPTLFGIDDRRRGTLPRGLVRSLAEVRTGATVTLADRVVCAWTTNPRTLAHRSVTIHYERVRAVVPTVYVQDGVDHVGVELVCDGFVWPLLFVDRPDLVALRDLLAGHPSGAVRPEWLDGVVAHWRVPDGRGGDRLVPGWRERA